MFLKLLLVFSFNAMSATSEIPARREFPVNEKINPCENLYEYACSKTIESFKLREDRRRHAFAFSDSSERILEFKKNHVKDLVKSTSNDPIANEIKNFYISCMDKTSRATEEKKYVVEKINELAKIKTKNEWLLDHAKRIHSEKSGFINYGAVDNFDDPRKSDLMLGVGYNFLPEKSYAKNPELVKDLELLIAKLFKTIGLDQPEEKAKVVLKYELDNQEARLFPAEARLAYSRRKYTSKKELLKNYPELSLNILLNQIPNKTLIRVLNTKTMPFLYNVAMNYSLEDLKTVELFYELSPKLDMNYPDYYQSAFDFKKKYFGGKNKRSELDEECTSIAMNTFGSEFDYLVLPKMFPNFSSKKVAELVTQIKTSILYSLEKNTWLSSKSKKEAKKKISSAYMRLVAPEKFEDWKFLPVFDYKLDSYLANIEIRNGIVDNREFKYFKELKDIRSWEGVDPLVVNAFYQPSYNQFTMLQGILQYPFYDQGNSDIENLAGIGMVVGHELGHGIDDQGSKYDSKGKLRDWMTEKDLKTFKELTTPLVDQYNKAGMNGAYTLGENIGDLVGMTSAYDAAFLNNKMSLEELKNAQKKFFLSYARVWCEVQLPGMRDLRIKSDPHSLGEQRVNEIVKHFSGFKDAFECKETDALVMPANKRVHIW